MTVEIQNNQSNYLVAQLGKDLATFQTDAAKEISQVKSSKIQNIEAPYKMIEDVYEPSNKISSEERVEARLKQVISTEEMKQLLSLVIRTPNSTTSKGQNVDILG